MKTEYHAGTVRSHRIGLAAIFLVWITAAISVPLIKVLNGRLSAEEILIWRSLACIALALAIVRGKVWRSTKETKQAGFLIGFSSIAFYRAIEVWDVNPVVVLGCFIPVVNVGIDVYGRKKTSSTIILSLCCILAGTAWALESWNQRFNPEGLMWSAAFVILGGIGFDMWGKAPETDTVLEKSFWLSLWTGVYAVLILVVARPFSGIAVYGDGRIAGILAIYLVLSAVFIFVSIIPFNRIGKMPTATASILLQAATPATIVGAFLLLGERLSLSQWLGVALALVGAGFLSVQSIQSEPSSTG